MKYKIVKIKNLKKASVTKTGALFMGKICTKGVIS